MQLKLLQAGYPGKNAVRTFHFAQMALGIGLLILGVGYAILKSSTGDPTTQQTILSIMIPGAVGYMAPKYWITRRVEARKEEIQNGFPDALDMMLVCVEAGQSLDQAIIRVSQGNPRRLPRARRRVVDRRPRDEGRQGPDPGAARLRRALRRCRRGSFTTVLIQSATFGTSIAEALRVYSGEMRDKRVMRAEEKANTLPTKMTLATMMLTVPPLLIILIGPSVYEVYETLKDISF